MTQVGTFVRRHFEPLVLSIQVVVDLLVVLAACGAGYLLGGELGGAGPEPDPEAHLRISYLAAAVVLVVFHTFGMYSPVKSLLNVEEFKAIAKSTVVSFFVLFTLIVFLRSTQQEFGSGPLEPIVAVHRLIDIEVDLYDFSRLRLALTFALILVFSTISRFASFKVIQALHRRGIGNRNVLIHGTGDMGRWLQRKFVLVPTLGLRLCGFVSEDEDEVGRSIERVPVLGSRRDLERLVKLHKIHEVFVALPEASEERVMDIVAEVERLGLGYRVVPRFYHLMAQRVRIETLDSIPLISRPERRERPIANAVKRLLDVVVSSTVLVLLAPLFVLTAILIKRESPGPVFYLQRRIGKDGKSFRMCKFRTMYTHLSGDALKPSDESDPRVTRVGRWLRRYSLDELPQFLNVLKGEMSVVGPRPEMPFIVDGYGPLERERLRAKPGITGLWQISYARTEAIHQNLDYDIYYVENQSFLLDLIIIALTLVAVVKGTGAH